MKNQAFKHLLLVIVFFISIVLSLLFLNFIIYDVIHYTEPYYRIIGAVDSPLNIFNILWLLVPFYIIYNLLTLAKYLKPFKFNFYLAFLSSLITILLPTQIPTTIANFISGLSIFERLGEIADFIGYLVFYAVQIIEFSLVVFLLVWIFKNQKSNRLRPGRNI